MGALTKLERVCHGQAEEKECCLVFKVRQVCNLHSKYFATSMENQDILLRLP